MALLFRDPVFNSRGAFIIRKGYEHIGKIDNELMWLDALGLQMSQWLDNDDRRNTGIWAPDAGPCDAKETRKPCKLPWGSKYYSHADREQVTSSF